ncbi:hypothetical protein HK099_002444, partial [Clydaea vesicula]
MSRVGSALKLSAKEPETARDSTFIKPRASANVRPSLSNYNKNQKEFTHHLELYLPQSLRCYDVTGRNLTATWIELSETAEQEHQELLKKTNKTLLYQLSKSDETNDGVYTSVYEGAAKRFDVSGLVPLTNYKFKLRVKWEEDENEDAWSTKSIMCEVKTT